MEPDTCIVLRYADHIQVAKHLSNRVAHVSAALNGYTAVYDKECDEGFPDNIRSVLSSELSRNFQCVALFLLTNHDLLCYDLYENGNLLDTYESAMSHHHLVKPSLRKGGNALRLCSAFGHPHNEAEVELVLQIRFGYDKRLAEALTETPTARTLFKNIGRWKAKSLANVLGIPYSLIGVGFYSIETDDIPKESAKSSLILTTRSKWL